MNYSKIASNLRVKIAKFSGYVSGDLHKSTKRFINEAIYGIMSSQSVMLTEIGRSLETGISLKKIEERFCRQLIKRGIWDTVHRQILSDAAPSVKDDTLLILDLSDLYKKYAEKMEYLTHVRDGSDGGSIVKGYWTNQVIAAELGKQEVIPLYHELYSQDAPDFTSENTQIIKAIDMVAGYVENRGVWVIDRGGDRNTLFDCLLDNNDKKRFVIRLVGNRNLIYGSKQELALNLACKCNTPYSETIVKEKYGEEKIYHISYGYMAVKLPGYKDQLYMLVVTGFGVKPMMLLTTEPLRKNRKVLYRLLGYYIKRWSIEETIRFIKQTYDLENIRVLKYERLRNMMSLLLAVFYFISVKLDTDQKLKIMTGHVLKQAKRIFGVPDFKYYALGDGLSSIFKRSPGKMPKIRPPNSSLQLGFEFA
ncbi:MAG: transposase [Mesoflavibacter sp.]|nr:transposase [Mesoflavibacter sp.]